MNARELRSYALARVFRGRGNHTMRTNLPRIAAAALFSVALLNTPASAAVIYDSIPNPQPPNVPSLGYQATQTAEFGGLVDFGGFYELTQGTILMSDWALASTYGSLSPTWDQDLTLNLYSANGSGLLPGALLATRTQTFSIPWRPEPTPGCGTAWLASNGSCYNGLAFTATFDFTGV